MSLPQKKSKERERRDFFQLAIHFVFAIILAHSFEMATNLLIPLNNIFDSSDNFLKSASLFLAYVIIISGWIGYARSMSEKPHKDNIKGAFRFLLDLIILFEYFYLLQLTTEVNYFQTEFHVVISSIFGTYLIWDCIKYFEYRGKKEQKITRNRGGRTVIFFILCLIASLCYHFTVIQDITGLSIPENTEIQTLTFIVIMLIISVGYRISKWDIRNKKRQFS